MKGILKQIQDEVKKLNSKQEELSRREKHILTIKDNTTQILKLLQVKQQPTAIEIKKQEPKNNNNNDKKIQSLDKTMDIKHRADVWSVIELSDLRIATGDRDGYLTLFKIDYDKNKWTKLNEEKCHYKSITFLSEFNDNVLASSSWDCTFKLWKINNNTLSLIKTLQGHTNNVYQVIPLSNGICASGSTDCTIKIWDINAEKEEILSLKEDYGVYSLLKLKDKDEMVSSGYGWSVSFWNTKTFIKEHSVGCCLCWSARGIIELPNHRIAVCGGHSSTIDIIDTEYYQRVKQIEYNGYIVKSDASWSSLIILNHGTFIYIHDERFCQISSTTHEVLVPIRMWDEFKGDAITIALNGKYIISDNRKCGISVFKVNYT